MLGVGIIGCGRIFDLHALSYTRTDKAKIVAVCDSSEGKARGKAEDLGISRVYTDYRELLKDDSVDLVEILVPHYLHAEMTIAAAEAGKHVSVQKPPAMNLREMDEMIAATRKAGVKFRVFENFIFYPPYRKAKEIMDSGEIGKVQSIRIKTTSGGGGCGWDVPWDALAWRLSRDLCGGGPNVWDDGYHKFSLGIFLGGPIDRVYAWIQSTEITPDIKVDAPALIIWKYKEPLKMGQWESTFAPNMYVPSKYYADDDRVEIQGELGYIWVNQCTGRLLDVAPLQVYKNGVLTNYGNLAKEWEDSFIASTLHFVDAILEDKEPILSGENARKVLQFALAALKSSETHQEVSPNSITE